MGQGLNRRELLMAAGAAAATCAAGAAAAEKSASTAASQRKIHPAVEQMEIWPGPKGYPWADTGIRLWTREAILRRVGGDRLMCTWTTGGFSEPTDGNFTMAAYSDDRGKTWGEPSILFRHSHRGLFTTELFVPRPGEVHAFLQTYTLGVWMTQLMSYRAISTDGGRTWSPPASIPGGIHNVWVNQGIVHSRGRWIIPVSWAELAGPQWCEPTVGRSPAATIAGGTACQTVELPHGANSELAYQAGNAWAWENHRFAVGAMVSDDGGASFRLKGYLCRQQPRCFFEPKVVELSDGSIALLTRELRDGWLWRSDSRDGGETWSPLARTEIPNPSAKVKLLRSRDGRIFLLHNPNPPPPATESKTMAMSKRTPLSLWVSDDDMRTWKVKVDLVTDPRGNLNYPDGYIDEEARQIHFAWEDGRSVFIARVPMDM